MFDHTSQELYCEAFSDEHLEVQCGDCRRQMACPLCKGGPCLLRTPGRYCRHYVSKRSPVDERWHKFLVDWRFREYVEETSAFSEFLAGRRGPLTRQELFGIFGHELWGI